MNRPVEIALVGAGGYGEQYLKVLFSQTVPCKLRLVGAVDPFPEGCQRLADLRAAGVPLYADLEQFFDGHRCDLVIIASPIQLHCAHTCLALDRGSHVLLEKPLCASSEQIALMEAAQTRAQKTVTVGFQWSFSLAVRQLKLDILAGRFGRPRRLRALMATPRGEDYYTRNTWAGGRTTAAGQPVLDSPVNNATAHFLHNMLYVLGDRPETSAWPEQVDAELGRANPIENYDTAALRIRVAGGVELLFYTSHAVPRERGPIFSYEFEKATVRFEPPSCHIVAELADGEVVDYGSPDSEPFQKLWDAIASAETGRLPICGIEAAAAHSACVVQAQAAPGGIYNFAPAQIREDRTGRSPIRYAVGLLELMNRCYEEGKLFSEAGCPLTRLC